MNLMVIVLIWIRDDGSLDQNGNGRGGEKWLNFGYIWNVKSKKICV